MEEISRRDLIKDVLAVSAAGGLAACSGGPTQVSQATRLSDAGWCWDGQALCAGGLPSLFGVGEGTRWFGLNKVCFMFHPNTTLAMEKLSDFDEVVCEISKSKIRQIQESDFEEPAKPGSFLQFWLNIGCGVIHHIDGSIETKIEEASKVSQLSRAFPNIKAAIDDDLQWIIRREGITPEDYATVYEAVKKDNPNLKLWSCVYTHELGGDTTPKYGVSAGKEDWVGFTQFMDVINLWVQDAGDLPNLDRYIDQCGEVFPDKPIILGCYLRDLVQYPTIAGVPMDMLKVQWEHVLEVCRRWSNRWLFDPGRLLY